MVGAMRSPGSETLPKSAADLNLPVFSEPQREHWPSTMSWADAMRVFAPMRENYMRHFDSPEARLREKNPKRFRLS